MTILEVFLFSLKKKKNSLKIFFISIHLNFIVIMNLYGFGLTAK